MIERMVDKNSMRFGAGLSAIVLIAAFLGDSVLLVAVIAVALGIGAAMGLRFSPFGYIYRAVKFAFRLQLPVDAEDGAAPRFAQFLGAVFLGGALLAFAADLRAIGWGLALLVAGLQTLLAATGLCIGCELYLFTKRLRAKEA